MERFGPCSFSDHQITAFLSHHKLPIGALIPMHSQAVVNWVFIADDYVLRINKPEIETDDAYTEQVAVPAVRKAGIETPELLVFDDSRQILDTVVTVYRRALGVALGRVHVPLNELPELYRALGAQVWRIQESVLEVPDPEGKLDKFELADPRGSLAKSREDHRIDAVTHDWLSEWLDHLGPAFQGEEPLKFAHQDLHSFNTLVMIDPLRLSCVIDWGDAGWAPTYEDFNAVPVWAAVWMIEGYELAGGTVDDGFLGRVLWNAIESVLSWRDFGGEDPWAPKNSSFWANLIRLVAMDLPSRHRQWLPKV